MRKNNQKSIPTSEVKSRVKMWRSGKNWVYGLLFFFGMTGISLGQAHTVHADTTTLSTDTEKATVASQLTAQKVVLQSSVQKATDDSNTPAADADATGSGTVAKASTEKSAVSEEKAGSVTDATQNTAESAPSAVETPSTAETSEASVEAPASSVTTKSSDDATQTAETTDTAEQTQSAVAESTTDATTATDDTTKSTDDEKTDGVTASTGADTKDSTSEETSTSNASAPASDATQPADSNETASAVGTSDTPRPEVSYKSMLTSAQASELADQSVNSSDSSVETGNLPEGFSVTDPAHPAGTDANAPDTGLYSFLEVTSGGTKAVLSVDRETATHTYIQTVSGTTFSKPVELGANQTYTDIAAFKVYTAASDAASVYVRPAGSANMDVNYDLFGYRDKSADSVQGYAAFKPVKQTQTTKYVDKTGEEIAPSVTMEGLSGQKYETGTPEALSGYDPEDLTNASGYMSPYMYKDQVFAEELYNSDGKDRGTLTYTLQDVDSGEMLVTWSPKSGMGGVLGGGVKNAPVTLEKGENSNISGFTGGASYKVPNIYLDQTTNVTYIYDASNVTVPVQYVDSFGNKIAPDASISMPFKTETTIDHPELTHYSYDNGYTATENDNPKSYTVTNFAEPGTITLHYIGDPETATVEHVDANGERISGSTDTMVNGQYGQTVIIDEKHDEHWNVTDYKPIGSVSYTFSDDGDKTIKVVYDKIQKASIWYVDNSGNAIDTSLLGDAPTQLSGISGDVVDITSPKIDGYTAFSDNPTQHTMSTNDSGVKLRYVPTEVNVTWETPAGSDTPVLISNAGTPVAGQPISDDDPTGPKWPDDLTIVGLGDNSDPNNLDGPQKALGSNGLVRTVQEKVNLFASPNATKTLTAPSVHYAYFRSDVQIDFSDPANPVESARDWVSFAGSNNAGFKDLLGTDFYPDNNYMAAVALYQFNPETQIAKAFDAQGKAVVLKNIKANDSIVVYGLPAFQVTADSPNSTFDIIYYTLNDLQRTFTQTVNFVDEDNQPIDGIDPDVQKVTATREPEVDLSNLDLPKTTGYSSWKLSATAFSSVAVKNIPGYIATGTAVGASSIDVDTTATATSAIITYKKITGSYTYKTPGADKPTTTTWTTDPDDPTKLADGTVPAVDNYTPMIDDGKGNLTPLEKDSTTGGYIIPAPAGDDPTASVNITYQANTGSVTVEFVDQNKNLTAIKPDQIFSGVVGTDVSFEKDINDQKIDRVIAGYVLVADGTQKQTTYGTQSQTVLVEYAASGRYTVTTPDKQTTPEIQYTTDLDNPGIATATAPYQEGYTPTSDNGTHFTPIKDPEGKITGYTFTPDDPTLPAKITYEAQNATMKVVFVDGSGKVISDEKSFTGKTGATIIYDGLIKSVVCYILQTDGTETVTTYSGAADQTAMMVYTASGTYTVTTPDKQTTPEIQYTTDPNQPSTVTATVPYKEGYTPTSDNGTHFTPVTDSEGKITGYTFTPDDPTLPADITYEAQDSTMKVVFVDDSGKVISDEKSFTGKTGSPIIYEGLIKSVPGYILQTDGTETETTYSGAADQTATMVYTASGTYTATTPSKQTTPETQYTTDPNQPRAATATIPYEAGYTPTSDNGTHFTPIKDLEGKITGYTFTPDNPTIPTKITYEAQDAAMKVVFVDGDGKEVSSEKSFTGKTGMTIIYDDLIKSVAGYILKTDGTETETTYSGAAGQTATMVYIASSTYTVTTPGNDPTAPAKYVTTDNPHIATATVPYKVGYTPTSDNGTDFTPIKDPEDKITGYAFTPDDPTLPAKITYEAQDATMKVVFVDGDGKEVSSEKSFTGKTGSPITYNGLNKSVPGYILQTDGTKTVTTYSGAADQTATMVYTASGTYTVTTPGNDPTAPAKYVTTDNPYIATATVPYKEGYTPTSDNGTDFQPVRDPEENIIGYTFTPDDPTKPATINFAPDSQKVIVHLIDTKGNAVENKAGKSNITVTGYTGESLSDNGAHPWQIDKEVPGYVISNDETANAFTFDDDDLNTQTVTITYLKQTETKDPDGNTTTLLTNGDGVIVAIDKNWVDGDHTHVDIDQDTHVAKITETPVGGQPGTPVAVQPGKTGNAGKTTLGNSEPAGGVTLTHTATNIGKTIETITSETQRAFTQIPAPLSVEAKDYYTTQVTNDPDGGKTTTTTNGNHDMTAIDKDWGDGDHTHVEVETGTGVVTVTETPKDGKPREPVTVKPKATGEAGKTAIDNGQPDGDIALTHSTPEGDQLTESITPDTKRLFKRTQSTGGTFTTTDHYYETQTTPDPDGGKTITKTNGDGDITAIDKDWADGDHSHVDIDTDAGVATIIETPKDGKPGEPVEVQPGEKGVDGKTTLDNGEPDGNVILTHAGTDGDATVETITPDTTRVFTYTQTTGDPDGGTTTTTTNVGGDITTIDKDWSDGDHSHVDIIPGTGVATITETPKGGQPGVPVAVKPGQTGTDGKTTIDNGEPDGNVILTHQATDGDKNKTIETITPDTTRSFGQMPVPVSTDASHYYETQVTHDPDGGTTTTKTNGDGDITTIDKDWADGDHSHVDITPSTGVATITETPKGGQPGTPVAVQPGTTGTAGTTTIDNGEPDGDISLTHPTPDEDQLTETITPDTQRSFTRTKSTGGTSTTAKDYYETQTTHDPDGGTTITKTNGDGDITTIDKTWGDGDHTHVAIATDTGIATITETPKDGQPTTPVEVQPGAKGADGKTALDNGEPNGEVILTHQGTDGDRTVETITPDTKRAFNRTPTPVATDADHYYGIELVTVEFVDEKGDVIRTNQVFEGKTAAAIDYSRDVNGQSLEKKISGYVMTADGTTAVTTYGKKNQTVQITYTKITGGYEVTTPEGTDTSDYQTDTDNPTTVEPGHIAYIPGYTPKTADGTPLTLDDPDDPDAGYTIPVPDDATTPTTVDYDPNAQTVEVHLVDTDGHPVENEDGQSVIYLHGVTAEPIHVWEINKNSPTYIVLEDGTTALATFDNIDGQNQIAEIIYLKKTQTNDPDGGTTTLLTDGNGTIVSIKKHWGTGIETQLDFDHGTATLTPDANTTPITLKPSEQGGSNTITATNGDDQGNTILTQKTPTGVITETITPAGVVSFLKIPTPVSTDAARYYTTQVTHDPDGGTTTTKTNGDGDITTIDKDWRDGDHSHVAIDVDTGIATLTETPKGSKVGTPVAVQPGDTGTDGQTTLNNGEPDGNIILTHQGTDGGKTIESITPDTSRSFSRMPAPVAITAKDYYETQISHDPDGGTTMTKTNGDGDITTIDKAWGDGDHAHVDVDLDAGVATITETPKDGKPGTPIAVQPGAAGTAGQTTLANGNPDGKIVLTHQDPDGGKTIETVAPDTSRAFSRMPAPLSVTADDYYNTQVTHDDDGGQTTTITDGDGKLTGIDKNWADGDHTQVTVDANTGDATIIDTDDEGNTTAPLTVQPGQTGTIGQTTLASGGPTGDIILTHVDPDGNQTTETVSRSGAATVTVARMTLPDTDVDDDATEPTPVPAKTAIRQQVVAPKAKRQHLAATDTIGHATTSMKQLPQTGDQQNHLGLIGAALIGSLSLLGFGKKRRKDDEE